MAEIVIAVAAKITEYLVRPMLIRPLRPIFCFKGIGDDFLGAKTKLEGIQETVHNAKVEARNNGHVIDNRLTQWLADVDKVMPDVNQLNECLEIQQKENCCSWCPGWTCNYKFSKRVLKKTKTMKSLCEDGQSLNLVTHPARLHQHIIGSSSSKAFVHSRSSKSAFDRIMEALEKDGVNIIGLYGETGMGKTMLAKQVAEEATKHFDPVVMVNVSKNQELRSIQGTVADFWNMKLEEDTVEGRASRLKLRLERGEKIILILDDVWKEFDFGAVGIPSPNNGCKILFTAHSKSDVPDDLQTQSYVQLAFLPEDEAWDLVQSIASINDEVRAHDGAKNAIAECKGRPKALVMLGRVLTGKSPDEWDEALKQLRASKHKVTEDLEVQAKKLSLRRERVETGIKKAEDNAEEIHKDVYNWLIDVDKVMKDKELFMSEFNQSRNFFDEHGDVTKAEELTIIVKKLWAEGDFDTISYASPLPQVLGSSSSTEFMLSQSAKLAFNQILEALQKDGVNIIGLYGMGGIGKTTLAEQVQIEVEKFNIFDNAIMVTISQKPEVSSIQGTIADLLDLKLEQETKEGRARKLKQRFKEGKILVILDDIWNRLDLKTIGITLNECKGCKILLTTRRKNVCDFMDCQTVIQLNLLSEDEAREFFMKKACLSEELKLNFPIEEIVAECNGLPIALATVGAALRNKGEDEWREALDKLRCSRLVDIVGVDNDETNAYKCLRLSYDYLAHSAEAQQAQLILLLCSLYPEDMCIQVETLSRYVYGMRLFHRVKSIEDARRKVRVTIRFLIESCLLLEGYLEDLVKIHDVVRDVILWIGGTEAREKNVLKVRDESDLKEFVRNKSFQNCRAVSFMAESVPVLSKYNQLECPNLETILIFGGEHRVVELSNEFFEYMTFLKVFDLRSVFGWFSKWRKRCRFRMPPSLHNLTNLRTLMLDWYECHNSSILGELRNLVILSLRGCEIDCGVEIVSGLKELGLLDLSEWEAEKAYPSHMIEAFSKLEELHGHVIRKCEVGEEKSSGSSSFEWKLPSNLVALSVRIEDATCIPMGFCFPNLATYFIRVGALDTNSIWSGASTSRCLELGGIEDESAMINICKKLLPTVLDLRLQEWKDLCSLTVFTSREGLFQRLERLDIGQCYKMERVFEFEEDENGKGTLHLQFLKILRLKYLYELKHVWKGPTRSVCLRSLTEITISFCSKLTCVFPSPLLATSLQQLETLRISHCDNLEEIISGRCDTDGDDFSCYMDNIQGVSHDLPQDTIKCFSSLKNVELMYCNKLKRVFTTSVVTNLHQLEKLVVQECYELEHILGKDEDGKEEPTIGVHFENLKTLKVSGCGKLKTIFPNCVSFPKLESLQLEHNGKLEHVFGRLDCGCPWQDYPFSKDRSVVGCPKLRTHFVAACIKNLSATKDGRIIDLLSVQAVEESVQFHSVDDTIQFQRQCLKLEEVGDLKRIWSWHTQNTSLSYLGALRVIDLPKLISFRPISCNLLLPLLAEKNLIVEGCPKSVIEFFSQQSYKQDNEMKYLFEFDDGEDEDDDYNYSSPKSFRKLFGGVRTVEEV